MENRFKKAKNLIANGVTCAIVSADEVITSCKKGVKPLLEVISSGKSVVGWVAADKVVGAGAAFLYARMQISALYAEVLSVDAKEVIERFGIAVEYGSLVPYIKNRKGDGVCPIEQCVKGCETCDDAFKKINERLNELVD